TGGGHRPTQGAGDGGQESKIHETPDESSGQTGDMSLPIQAALVQFDYIKKSFIIKVLSGYSCAIKTTFQATNLEGYRVPGYTMVFLWESL
ncbi:MAG: hypothetical protein WCP34_06065, partial [Pseudomonadota bacterium]